MPNAYSPDQVKSKLGWSNSFDRNAAFPLDFAAYFGSYEDAEEAAATAVEVGSTDSKYYYGMQVYVFDGTNARTYIIQGDKTLKEIGDNAPMQFVADEKAMLALQNIEIGQQVFREDTSSIWIYKGGTITDINNWVESASSGSDTVWSGTENRVIFRAITQTAFDSLDPKDTNTLYFLTDAGKIYKGSTDVTNCVTVGTIPQIAEAVKGRLYIDNNTFAMAVTMDGANWIQASPGYLTNGTEWAAADSNKLATIGLIKKGIQEAIDAIALTTAFENSTGTVTVGAGAGAVLTGVAHDPQWDAGQLTLTIPVYGGSSIVVNIPKDKFVTAGQYYKDYPDSDSATHHNVIVLTIDNQEEPVIIPAEALVNVYTADNTDKNVAITVSEDNKISASVVIDPEEGNALVTSATGLKVDISGKMDKISSATGTRIAMTTADGGISESSYTVLTEGDMGSANTVIPTANLIAAAISAAVNSSVANKVDKVVGVENNIVGFAPEGAIKDTGKKVGGATLAEDPDENTVATEAAVNAAVEEVALTWGTLE